MSQTNDYRSTAKYRINWSVGTLITFRLGMSDAKYFASEYEPVFTAQNIANLPNYEIYLILMIDTTPSKAFSARTVRWE